MMIAPSMSIVAPLPLLSRNAPRNGVSTIARIGNQRKRSAASVLGMLRVTSRKFVAYLWNGLVRAPSCFCRVSVAPYLKPNSIIGAIIATEIIKEERDKPIKENDIIKCIHNREDGTIYENCCSKCPKERFKALVEYHSLHGKYTDALNATMLAKQTLFTHFPFIKQKTSH